MNTILTRHFIHRCIITLRTVNKQHLHSSINVMGAKDISSSDSSDSSDSDDDKSKKEINKQSKNVSSIDEKSKEKLNILLSKMLSETSTTRTFRSVPKRIKEPKPLEKLSLEQSIRTAAKETADYLGGDTEKTRKKLVDKALSARIPSQTSQIKGSPEKSQDTISGSKVSLSELLSGMKKYKATEEPLEDSEYSKSEKIKELYHKFTQRNHLPTPYRVEQVAVKLFNTKPLEIFDKIENDINTPHQAIATWRALEQKELELLFERSPDNILQEMIQWTKKGILWKFPINNEIGYEEEESIPFSEHVFMERHIEDWCPKKGPIRHFMELVCIGLSKNPYMKVQEKIDHLIWYKEFFGERQELLREINAITDLLPSKNSKQIES